MNSRTRRFVLAALPFLLGPALLPPSPALAERMEPLPRELEGVGIEQRLGAKVPLDLVFQDENGHQVRLGDFFTSGRPVLLDLGYYQCPMLCNLVLNGMVEAIRPLPFVPARDYEIVVVSIDPTETPDLARAKKENYVREYGRPGTEAGWHFLTGREPEIKKLTAALGFGYRYVPDTREYAHGAALYILTGGGVVSRVLTGVQFDPRTVRLSLAEASEGTVGGPLDQVLLFCFHYDAEAGRYGWAAQRLMKLGGALTLIVFGSVLVSLWTRDRRRRAGEAGNPEHRA